MPKTKHKPSSASNTFHRDDLVLARLTGYPKWPAMIVRGSQMPNAVRSEFARSGKMFAVRFLPDADYAFFNGPSLEPLDDPKIAEYLVPRRNAPRKKNQHLRSAYKLAQDDPVAWARKMDAIVEQERAVQDLAAASGEDAASQYGSDEEEEHEDASKGEREAGTSNQAGKPGDDEELEAFASGASEEGDASAPYVQPDSPRPARKRAKRQVRADIEEEAEAEAMLEPTARPAKRTRKSSNKNGWAGDLTSPRIATLQAVPQAGIRPEDRPKQVKTWRFELQRIFLGRSGMLYDSMDRAAEQFDMLEKFPSITVEEISFSKINKVLKRIITLKSLIPDEVEARYNFAGRSEKLLQDWNRRLGVL